METMISAGRASAVSQRSCGGQVESSASFDPGFVAERFGRRTALELRWLAGTVKKSRISHPSIGGNPPGARFTGVSRAFSESSQNPASSEM